MGGKSVLLSWVVKVCQYIWVVKVCHYIRVTNRKDENFQGGQKKLGGTFQGGKKVAASGINMVVSTRAENPIFPCRSCCNVPLCTTVVRTSLVLILFDR